MEGITPNSCTRTVIEKTTKPQEQVNCPRCNSTNTKFCYYNNYSLTQPRYFCKTCRRYWTAGGSLRNIPVGGGSRKNKRVSSSSTTTNSSKVLPEFKLNPPTFSSQNMRGHDLNLAFPTMENYHGMSPYVNVPSFMMPSSNAVYPSGFPMQEIIKPNLGFSIDGVVQENGGGGSNGTLLFPFGDMKQICTSIEVEHNKDQQGNNNSTGYWTGMIGEGHHGN